MRPRKEGGTILILLSLAVLLIIALAAMAIDLGQAELTGEKLQIAADLAAVSAAQVLPDQSAATTVANQVIVANGLTSATVSFPQAGRVKVSVNQSVKYFFARYFGSKTKVVAASATAEKQGTITPVGIKDRVLTPGTSYNFTWEQLNGANIGNGEFCSVDLSSSGGGDYVNNIENGYAGAVTVGSNLNTLFDAGVPAQTYQGVAVDASNNNALFQQAVGSPWFDTGLNYSYPNYPADDPRIVTIVFITQIVNRQPQVLVERFGTGYLETINATGKIINLRYIADGAAGGGSSPKLIQ